MKRGSDVEPRSNRKRTGIEPELRGAAVRVRAVSPLGCDVVRWNRVRGVIMAIVAGEYKLAADMFTMGGAVFKVRERKANPRKFLIRTSPFQYISSLYPMSEPDCYGFELGRKWWVMKFGAGSVRIWEPKPLASPFPEPNPYADWIR